MPWLKWIIVVLATLDAGYMTFDGARALVTGDYLTPKTGEYAGQLGPWHHLASAVGIEPRSTLMKSIFLGHGLIWLVCVAAFATGARWAWWPMLAVSAASMWNLIFGTVQGAIIVALLLLPAVRRAYLG